MCEWRRRRGRRDSEGRRRGGRRGVVPSLCCLFLCIAGSGWARCRHSDQRHRHHVNVPLPLGTHVAMALLMHPRPPLNPQRPTPTPLAPTVHPPPPLHPYPSTHTPIHPHRLPPPPPSPPPHLRQQVQSVPAPLLVNKRVARPGDSAVSGVRAQGGHPRQRLGQQALDGLRGGGGDTGVRVGALLGFEG